MKNWKEIWSRGGYRLYSLYCEMEDGGEEVYAPESAEVALMEVVRLAQEDGYEVVGMSRSPGESNGVWVLCRRKVD